MIRNSIVAKLWLTIVSIFVIVLFLLGVFLQQFLDNYERQQQAVALSRLAAQIERLVVSHDKNALVLSHNLARADEAAVVINAPMTETGSLSKAYARLSPSERRILSNHGTVQIRSLIHGTDTVSIFHEFSYDGRRNALISVTQPASILNAPVVRMRNLIVFAMALGVLMATGLAFVVLKNLSRPLLQMTEVAEEMSHGTFAAQIEVVTTDEVGRLGRTFNALASELSQTIAMLSMERDQLQSILESLHDGVFAVNLEGVVTLANPPATRRLETMRFEESSTPDGRLLPKRLEPLFHEVTDKRDSIVVETIWNNRNTIVSMIPLFESDRENVRGVVCVLRDVTEERRLDRLRKDFIANVSHELRTPLSMMQGYTEALLDEFGDDLLARKELTEIIHDETLRMKRLVSDLLDLAQLQSGQFQMNFTKSDIVGLLRRVARKFQTLAVEREVRLTTELGSEAVLVFVDLDRMEQVFTNLIDNALRHTMSGGQVTISLAKNAHRVVVEVEDTGSGIPEEDLPYIWERFYKADKARTRSSSGTGLGLAIVRQIVTEHDGEVLARSQVGQGTTFAVVLPVAV